MRLFSASAFAKDLILILTKTVDGINALLWSLLFVAKAISPAILGAGEFDGWIYLMFVVVIVLMLIRSRIDDDEKKVINIGSFVSVTVFSLIFIFR